MKAIVTLYIIVALMSVMMVSAQESWETTDDDWNLDNMNVELLGNFGEETSWWQKFFGNTFAFVEQDAFKVTSNDFTYVRKVDIGNVKNGYLAGAGGLPLSTVPGINNQDYRIKNGFYEFLLGARCDVGQYMLVKYSHTYGASPNSVAYSHFWAKTWSGDIIYGADSKYWTSGLGGTISYACYDKKPVQVPLYNFVCNNGEGGLGSWSGTSVSQTEYYSRVFTCPSGVCKVAKQSSSIFLTASQLQTQMCAQDITCYRCSGTNVETKQASSCTSGWTSSRLYNSDCRVTCYSCDSEGQSITETFSTSEGCRGEWSSTRRSCQQPTVSCFQCSEGAVVSQTFQGSCGTGWSSSSATLNCQAELPTCYTCEDGFLMSEKMVSCPIGASTVPLNCQVPTVDCGKCTGGDAEYQTFSGECGFGWKRVPMDSELICSDDEKIDWQMFIIIGVIILVILVITLTLIGGGKKGKKSRRS